MTDSPWYRAQSDWMFSGWVIELGYPVAGILHWFLGHCKTHGNNRGKCRRIPDAVFARMYGIPEQDVTTFLEAAEKAGAITDDGKAWEITAWADYQSPDAERKRKERERTTPDTSIDVRDNSDLSVTNATCPVACHATTTQTETVTTSNEVVCADAPKKPKRESPPRFVKPTKVEVADYFRERGSNGDEARRFWDYQEMRNWEVSGKQMRDWRAAIRYWLSRPTTPQPRGPTRDRRDISTTLQQQTEQVMEAIYGSG